MLFHSSLPESTEKPAHTEHGSHRSDRHTSPPAHTIQSHRHCSFVSAPLYTAVRSEALSTQPPSDTIIWHSTDTLSLFPESDEMPLLSLHFERPLWSVWCIPPHFLPSNPLENTEAYWYPFSTAGPTARAAIYPGKSSHSPTYWPPAWIPQDVRQPVPVSVHTLCVSCESHPSSA